jgi:hypothetical protein
MYFFSNLSFGASVRNRIGNISAQHSPHLAQITTSINIYYKLRYTEILWKIPDMQILEYVHGKYFV